MNTTFERRSLPVGWILVFFFISTILVLGIIQLNTHAIEKHGPLAIETVKCIDENGVEFEMINPESKRAAEICHDPKNNNGWYILIVCAITGCVITAFKKDKMKRKEQVQRYLENGGYRL